MQFINWKSTIILSLSILSLGFFVPLVGAQDTYGGGETEISLRIVKEVRLEGDTSYKDKVFIDLTDSDERTKEIYFRITITNTGDDVSNLKMEDFLPSELSMIAGNLTEEWNSMSAGEEKTFVIKVSLKGSEIKEDADYEKCVVNKAELRQDGDFVGSDVATVCYGNKPQELPETGFWPLSGFAGLGMMSLGGLLGKKKKPATKKKK